MRNYLIVLSLLLVVLCVLVSCGQNKKHEHVYSADITEYTCTEQGYTTYTCECGDSYISDYTEPAHRWGEWIVIEESTQQQNGIMERYCKECDAKESTEDR